MEIWRDGEMARWRDGEMARWRDGKGDEMKICSYQDLDVWKRGMDIAVSAFMLTKAYPSDEKFGMISQMRRAANSIPANIAEGWARQSKKEFVYFLRVAQGSLRELETHLLLSQRCGLSDTSETAPILDEIIILSKQLRALLISLTGATDAQ